jgi:hypothetical protein
MSDNYARFLLAEIAEAETCLANATREEVAGGFEIEATMAREYWTGYLAGVTNALNEYNGPGDVN